MDLIVEVLKNNEVFASFSEDEIKAMMNYCEQIYVTQNETIFIEGKNDDAAVFFIQEGTVKIFKGLDRNAKVLAMFNGGNVFGEMSFLDPEPRSATAVASEESVIYKLLPERFSEFANSHPKAAMKLFKIFIKKLVVRLRQTSATLLTRDDNVITT